MATLRLDGCDAELTTEHSASSYGIPVLVIGGEAYGKGDPIAFAGYANGEQLVLVAARRLGLEDNPLVQRFLGYRPATALEVDQRLQEERDAAYLDN